MRRGALRFAILTLLAAGERHGYDLLREMRARGWGTPGPASVYPVLAMLETAGLVQGREEDGRRIYELTKAGRDFLADHADRVDEILADLSHASAEAQPSEEVASLRLSMERLARAVSQLDEHSREPTRVKVQEILDRARKEIYTLLSDE